MPFMVFVNYFKIRLQNWWKRRRFHLLDNKKLSSKVDKYDFTGQLFVFHGLSWVNSLLAARRFLPEKDRQAMQ